MKTILKSSLLILLFFSTQLCHGQGIAGVFPPNIQKYEVLDSAKYVFAYQLTFIPDTTKLSETETNKLLLQIGDKISKFASVDFYMERELEKQIKEMGLEKKGTGLLVRGTGVAGTEIYKDLNAKKETVTTRIFGIGDVYVYEEDMANLKWNISPETATILSYTCMKATTQFLGRTYEAWFAMDIPINNGPWKFGGLPGLILKIADTKGHYNFECMGIKELETKEPIIKSDAVYVNKSRKDLNKLIQLQHRNFAQFAEMMGKTVINRGNGTPRPFPYNPIDRE